MEHFGGDCETYDVQKDMRGGMKGCRWQMVASIIKCGSHKMYFSYQYVSKVEEVRGGEHVGGWDGRGVLRDVRGDEVCEVEKCAIGK